MIAADTKPTGGYKIAFAGALISALGLKAALIISNSIPFHGDEAVVGLMARHILEGARPVFYYGQTYMGSLDAYLVAAGFGLFGAKVWVIRLIQVSLYLGVVFTTGFIAQRITRSKTAAVTATWFMAVPTVNTSLYTTVSLGGYGEVLLLGNLTLLCSLWIAEKIIHKRSVPFGVYWIFGFLSGLGFWILGLSAVFSIPALIYTGWYMLKNRAAGNRIKLVLPVSAALFGIIAGSIPWWLSSLSMSGESQARILFGSLLSADFFGRLSQNFLNLSVYGVTVIIGVRPPWSLDWLVYPVAPLIVAFWVVVFWHRIRNLSLPINGLNTGYVLLLLVVFVLLGGFLLTPFGRDPSGRYFLPLAAPMAVLAGAFIAEAAARYRKAAFLLAGLILGYHGLGTLQAAQLNPPGLTTQLDEIAQVDQAYIESLIEFLQQHNETRGYSNYWISYPLAFLSDEKIIFAPALPYREDLMFNARDNRYPPYSDLVKDSDRVAYITARLPELDDYLRRKFEEMGITWLEEQTGDFRIFYNLSEVVHAGELEIELMIP